MDFVTGIQTVPENQRSRKRRTKARNYDKENTLHGNTGVSLGGALAASAACLGAGLVRHLWQRQQTLSSELAATQSELQRASSRVSELSEELESTREDLEAAVAALEEKTSALAQEQTALEHAKGELGLTQSRFTLIERELTSTKQTLSTYLNQLDKARYELAASRANPPSPGGLWTS